MKAFAWIFARTNARNLNAASLNTLSLNTVIARRKLALTMPGETGALASLRLTGCGL